MTRPTLYRPCVGLCLFNDRGQVFVGERLDRSGAWQMPQGGIDPGEDVRTAAMRELKEETGTDKAEIMRIHGTPLRYDIPDDVRAGISWGQTYIGQEQTWVALRFTGIDADINLSAHTPVEFGRYQWVPLHDVVKLIVPFKIPTYEYVIAAFMDLAVSS
jgi:putative (di)nucleoside polyphosphate hydrolase